MQVLSDSHFLVSQVERPECDILLVEIGAWSNDLYGPKEIAAIELLAPRIAKAEFFRVPAKDDLTWVARAERLEELCVKECGTTDEGLRHIGLRNTLRHIELDGNAVSDRGLMHLKELALDKLSLVKTNVTAAGIGSLRCIESATDLWLWQTRMNDDVWSALTKAKRLETLAVSGTKVTGRGISALKHLRLHTLKLDDSEFDNVGLAELADNVHVEQDLGLAGTKVDDDGVAALCRMDGPFRISLDRTKVTDIGLLRLKDLVHPKYLYLTDTAVTDAGIEAFRRARPGKIISRFDELPPDDPLRIEREPSSTDE